MGGADHGCQGACALAAAALGETAFSLSTALLHARLRLAFTVPWIGKRFPSWFPYFLASCGRSGYIADWLIFHEGAKMPDAAEVPPSQPANQPVLHTSTEDRPTRPHHTASC